MLKELGLNSPTIQSISKISVSSRNRILLLEMGLAHVFEITIGDLSEKSWELFSHHAFPYNKGNPPANIDKRREGSCVISVGGFPLWSK